MITDFNRVKALFGEAQAIASPVERAPFLEKACQGDAALRESVETFLAAQSDLGDFLERTALGQPLERPSEAAGTIVGRYRLLEPIGEGGSGVVNRAEQTEPVKREVALKIIKPGMDSQEVVARFEAERQALARLEHPNIARVYDAGTTDKGRPYFVMDLIDGEPITKYCDRRNLPLAQRFALFIQLCEAVQHAHSRGIIHRDLKPSNVVVIEEEGRPLVKVIDFGIAKSLQGELTGRTLITRREVLLGTPAYMSPEQLNLGADQVDVRSDVYSLGVLLYELIAGAPPFESDTLRQAAFAEVQRILREVEPQKPSAHFERLGPKTTEIAQRRALQDGRELLCRRQGEAWVLISVETAAVRELLRHETPAKATHVRLSPDGAFATYALVESGEGEDAKHNIYLLEVATGRTNQITSWPGDETTPITQDSRSCF